MPRLAVFVSHSGKTVELEVGPHARVEAVQQTLADLTGIPLADQILMCEGARLDAAKSLSAYGLPGDERDKVHDLFLYSRAHLRAGTPLPPPEELPECPVDLSGLELIRQQRHRLDAAGSPLLRALPDYQRQFQEHLLQANARHEASQQRMATCARLVSEQEVQALSIDAATANVEVHYAYICDAYGAFMGRYQQQAAVHADVLSRFEADLAYLAATELHPALRGSTDALAAAASGSSPGPSPASASSAFAGQAQAGPPPASLVHLVNAPALRDAAAAAARGHQHFGGKVAELEALFGMLKADVEALFMQAPSVDLEALTRELEDMHGQVDEQASIVAALSSDLGKVQQLVEQASEQLAATSDPLAALQVSDTVHMLETMHETHVGHLLPRVAACHTAVEAFAARCLDCKNALTRDVFTQLRTISSQQSKIREMKNKLALFREALARQDASVQDLLVVRRVPAAYKQCLAECVRREAFMEKYAHSAAALAERMGTFRQKELAMRESFRKHVERLIPAALLERMGLLEQPPHCQVSVSASEGEHLLPVTVDDVRRIQLPWGTASVLGGMAQQQQQPLQQQQQQAAGGSREAGAAQAGSGAAAAAAEQQQQEAAAAAAAAEPDITASLQLENAKLRAELASAIALDCIRAAQLASVASLGAAAAAAAASAGAAASGSGQASPHLAASSPRGGGAPGTAAAAAAPAVAAAVSLPPDAAQRFERALAAKDGLVTELQAQLAGSRQQSAAYEARIHALEEQLSALAAEGRRASASADGASTRGGTAPAPAPASAAAGHSSQPVAAAAAAPLSAPPAGGDSLQRQLQQEAASAGLWASVDAAAGSSLAGQLQTPDVSRSLGPSSSLGVPPTARGQLSQQQEPQVGLDAARGPAAGEGQEGSTSAAPHGPAALSTAACAAAGSQSQSRSQPGGVIQPGGAGPAGAGALPLPASVDAPTPPTTASAGATASDAAPGAAMAGAAASAPEAESVGAAPAAAARGGSEAAAASAAAEQGRPAAEPRIHEEPAAAAEVEAAEAQAAESQAAEAQAEAQAAEAQAAEAQAAEAQAAEAQAAEAQAAEAQAAEAEAEDQPVADQPVADTAAAAEPAAQAATEASRQQAAGAGEVEAEGGEAHQPAAEGQPEAEGEAAAASEGRLAAQGQAEEEAGAPEEAAPAPPAEPHPQPAAAPQQAPASAPAPAPPPPHPLLSSLMEGEGSDVEGVEPVSESEAEGEGEADPECEAGPPPHAGRQPGGGSPGGSSASHAAGYDSAHSSAGSEAPAVEDEEEEAAGEAAGMPAAATAASSAAAVAAQEEEEEEDADSEEHASGHAT